MQQADIWIVTNPNANGRLKDDFANVDINNVELPSETKQVLNKAYQGKTSTYNNYDMIYGTNMIHIATPIRNSGGNVIGAVLVNCAVEVQDRTISQAKKYLQLSLIVALAISIILAFVFAMEISRPVAKMKRAALSLAQGNYIINKIRRKDEIGQLAVSLNQLSEQLKENEEMREQEEQRRCEFFSNISHELRTPITVVKGYVEALNDGYVTDLNKQKDYHLRILNECSGMERLVSDLLALSKMQNPEFSLNNEVINVIAVLQDAFRSERLLIRQNHMIDTVEFENECAFIFGDYDRIRQLFLVIINNAIHYCPTGTYIRGKVIVEQDSVSITIEDNGPGIDEEDQAHIFEQFYRGKTGADKDGSGLGLVVAMSITKRHNGTIYVKNVVPHGTCFVMEFPKVEAPE